MNQLEISLCDGKYTVVQDENGRLTALRYGEPWRDCVGDNLIFALAYEVEKLRHDIQAYRGALGYPVPGDHPGTLTDGTKPECGLCNSEYRRNLKAECTKLREALASVRDWGRSLPGWDESLVSHVLSSKDDQ